MTDRIYIWFADNGNISKWSREPFEEGTEYRRSTVIPAEIAGVVEEWRKAAEGVTPGPWGWVIHDHSMASLGVLPDPGLGDPLVLCVSPCKSCQDRADPQEWKWGRCHTPSTKDAKWLARCSPDAIASLLTIIERLAASQVETRRLALEEAAAHLKRQPSFGDGKWAAAHVRALVNQPSTEGGKDG